MNRKPNRGRKEEAGVAMILTILLLLLVSGIGIAAIEHAGEESVMAASSRRWTRTFFAADAGIQMALSRIAQTPPDLTQFTFTLENGATLVQSGTAAAPAPIQSVGSGAPPDGYSINLGAGFQTSLYRAQVAALGPAAATVQLEAKFAKLDSGAGY
ncbi:MAG: PilX N-terminal domain-containing pilus assembly protein [Myxococcota bacterium]